LAKIKIVDPTVFAATFLPRRIWSRAFGRARFFFAAFSRAVPPVCKHPGRRRFLVPVSETLQVVIKGFLT
jgi:hypothetical protein